VGRRTLETKTGNWQEGGENGMMRSLQFMITFTKYFAVLKSRKNTWAIFGPLMG
jgi:hypothetical protein